MQSKLFSITDLQCKLNFQTTFQLNVKKTIQIKILIAYLPQEKLNSKIIVGLWILGCLYIFQNIMKQRLVCNSINLGKNEYK